MSAWPRFYPIVDSADWVHRLAPLGVELVQLRIKERPPQVVRLEVRAARAICRSRQIQLVVNDHWQIALDEGADFIHLGQQDLASADLKAIRARGAKLGISTHDRAELDNALAHTPDYVALGPIYPTTLKQMPWAPQGLPRLDVWKRLVGNRPLVAIGGITLERAAGCFEAGADCVAMVSDVTRHPDPSARVANWIAATGARA
ncbi:MAG: thiamine phosphate synthase [Rhodanobacter sp.]|nr:MAG: thiamine phosphate synthase [Rhodanobacter sp.]TAL88752.1 MAG: thiamine phosphate synthase [Rhodanobacter sp.]TAM39444.1 MAG: thiamine phosphate synthase [Rhodanobacter sp.]TAN26927.1 MAG: thiamine phosphate synthase [Rhodanobacter sp.]